jgi:AmmeMemoRadiSam system protein A
MSGDGSGPVGVDGALLLSLARGAIAERFGGPRVPRPDDQPWLDELGAVFVSLKVQGELRGCVGQVVARWPLFEAVREAATSAAFRDSRFLPLREEELGRVRLEVSLLSPLERLEVSTEEEVLAALRPGVDGLVLTHEFRSGLFIPEVWKQVPEKKDFLAHLKRKAGLPMHTWLHGTKVERFTATHWEEP